VVQPASRAQISVGDTTVTYLPDGHGWLNSAALFPASSPDGWATHAEFLDTEGRFPVSIGSFLIRTAKRVILVDLGLGAVDFTVPDLAAFKGGGLLTALAAEGLAPSDVDTVVYTHLHHDHVGWTTNVAPAPNAPDSQGVTGLTFADAEHLVSEAEWRHWAGTDELVGPDPAAVQAPLTDRIAFLADGEDVAPGVRVRATPGHTPGHASLLVTDPAGRDARRLVILGDVMHCQVQVIESHWSFAFDADPERGIATREQLLKELEDDDTVLAGGHFAGNVFGRVLPPTARRAWASTLSVS
jgi:glyoxylase-like metal-dependent hydrolase (beta-lactamase superfamily II)